MISFTIEQHWFGDRILENLKSATVSAMEESVTRIKDAIIESMGPTGPRAPSKPFKPPHQQTGGYARTIFSEVSDTNYSRTDGQVASSSPLSFWLEYGTPHRRSSKMAARPHFGPVVYRMFGSSGGTIKKIFQKHMQDAIGGGGK